MRVVFPPGTEFGMREPPFIPTPSFFFSGVFLIICPPFLGVLCSVLPFKVGFRVPPHFNIAWSSREWKRETLLGNNFSPTSLSMAVRTSHTSCRSSTPKRFHPYMSPHLFPCLFSSSRCILLSVISNRLKVTAAALHRALSLSLSLSLSHSLSLSLSLCQTQAHFHTHTRTHTHTHTHRLVCEAPSGLKVLSQSSGVTTAVKLPVNPAKVALSHVSQQSRSLFSLFFLHPSRSFLSLSPWLTLSDIVSHTHSGPTLHSLIA